MLSGWNGGLSPLYVGPDTGKPALKFDNPPMNWDPQFEKPFYSTVDPGPAWGFRGPDPTCRGKIRV